MVLFLRAGQSVTVRRTPLGLIYVIVLLLDAAHPIQSMRAVVRLLIRTLDTRRTS